MKNTYKTLVVSMLAGLTCLDFAQADSISIVGIETQRVIAAGGFAVTGQRPDIATDSEEQAHIFADIPGSRAMLRWHNISDSWISATNTYPNQSAQWFNPRVEINKHDQLWVSGVRWWSEAMRVMVFANVDENPTLISSFTSKGGYNGLPVGNLSLDIHTNNEATVYGGNGGFFQRYLYNGTNVVSTGVGNLRAGAGGEKNFYFISRAGQENHASNVVRRVEHGCTDWSYNNSVRASYGLNRIVWCQPGRYPTGDDGAYPMVVGDSQEPQTAYLAHGYMANRVYLNIWKGATNANRGAFVRAPNNIIQVDIGSSGLRRYQARLAPANNGGAWICYTSGGKVKIRYIPSTTTGPADIGTVANGKAIELPGYLGSIAVDEEGDLHVTYLNGLNGVTRRMYTKVDVAGDR